VFKTGGDVAEQLLDPTTHCLVLTLRVLRHHFRNRQSLATT
jgi:hypothetical protein